MTAWTSIHHGAYVDWSARDPLRGTDPYLVWADGCGFAPYGGSLNDGRLPTLIELRPGRTAHDLVTASQGSVQADGIPASYWNQRTSTAFLTAWPSAGFFAALPTRLADVVARAEISCPVVPERPRYRPLKPPTCGVAASRPVSGKLLLGVIDDGCAFAAAGLLDSKGRSRIARLWNQDESGAFEAQGHIPTDFGRGHEIGGAALQALMAAHTHSSILDEDGCYGAANYHGLRRRATHGAHVTDVFAGRWSVGSRIGSATRPPEWRPAKDIASSDDTGIVFVQLPRACLQDPSGGWLDVQVLDAIRYILSCASEATERIVINLSFGPQRGPNDGSSMLESAIAALAIAEPRLTVVVAGGNSFESRGHASLTLQPGESRPLQWQIMPGDETPSFLQLWTPSDRPGLQVRLTPPGAPPGPWVAAGEAMVWPTAHQPLCGVVFTPRAARGVGSDMALVSLQASMSYRDGAALAPHGIWQLDCRHAGDSGALTVRAWIDRDDFNLGTAVRGRQSVFVDPLYDPLRYLRAAEDDHAGSGAVVQRRGTLTGLATGKGAWVAAGYRISDGGHPLYSSAGPTGTAARVGPDWAAATDQSRTLPGLLAAGTRGQSMVRMVGTSVAAPQLARWLANGTPLPPPAPAPEPQLQGRGRLPLK